jgi:hypothetical protein
VDEKSSSEEKKFSGENDISSPEEKRSSRVDETSSPEEKNLPERFSVFQAIDVFDRAYTPRKLRQFEMHPLLTPCNLFIGSIYNIAPLYASSTERHFLFTLI